MNTCLICRLIVCRSCAAAWFGKLTTQQTIDEIYHSMGQYVVNNILRDDWEKATLFIDIVEKSVGLKGKLILADREMDTFDTPANFLLAIDILPLHKKSTENIINRWNKSEFVLNRAGKFEMNFIWDQDYQDRIDNSRRQ